MKNRALLLSLVASAFALPATAAAQDRPDTDKVGERDLLFPVKIDGKWGVVNGSGEIVIPAHYLFTDVWKDDLIRVQVEGFKSGVLNRDGETVIPAKFRYIFDFQGREYTTARMDEEQRVIIDRAGKIVLGPGFQTIEPFEKDRAWVVGDGRKKGVITIDCEWLLEPKYDRISAVMSNGLSRVERKPGSVGVVNREGKWLARPGKRFEGIFPLVRDGLMAAKSNGKWGFVDSNLEWAIEPIDTSKSLYSGPLLYTNPTAAVIEIDGKHGVIDRNGNVIIPLEHENVFGGTGVAFTALRDGKYGAYDRAGNLIVPFEYDRLSAFSDEGIAGARKGTRRFSIDLSGKEVEVPKSPGVRRIGSSGWAPEKRDGKWGAVNAAGEWVLEPVYDCVELCHDQPMLPPPPSMGPAYKPLPKGSVKRPREQDWCRLDD